MTTDTIIKPEPIDNSSAGVSSGLRLAVSVRVLDDGTSVVDANEIRRELLKSTDQLQALREFAANHVGA
ncbi:MAG: hypothetical protein Tsb0027_02080 [Wenzhouxiangellaceae bacterium]